MIDEVAAWDPAVFRFVSETVRVASVLENSVPGREFSAKPRPASLVVRGTDPSNEISNFESFRHLGLHSTLVTGQQHRRIHSRGVTLSQSDSLQGRRRGAAA